MKIELESAAEQVAENLLKIGAIKLSPQQPFRWASGWNSPIYCDNRLALSFPQVRTLIKTTLVAYCRQYFPDAEAIAGVATAGIPQGALLAEELGLPFVYVRPKPKDHGLENLIEGKVTKGQKIVVLEDLISTGGSSLKATEELRKAGFEILGMLAIFTYGFKVADEAFSSAGVKLVTLSNYNALVQIAVDKGYISPKDLESLKIWREAPQDWRVA
jgi:orotate phosphoribosyltransferase